jgi:CubicO group peptidase (beta-lactamase class C family)
MHGMAFAIVEGGEVTFATGLGSKRSGGDEWVRTSTLFRIGSLTKMLTTVATLQQVDAGSVDLDAPITDYLLGLSFDGDPTWAPSITTRHLLTHASAMDDILPADAPETHDDALREFVFGDFCSRVYLMAPAGRMWNYSSPNFYIAGLIVEILSGQYYRHYMRDNVFLPIGMQRTYLLPEEVLTDGDYATGANGWEPDQFDNGWGRPAAHAFSSVLDMAEFMKFLRNGDTQILSDELRSAMLSPQIDTEQVLDLVHWSLGLMILENWFIGGIGTNFYNLRQVYHNGLLAGYNSTFTWIPELDFGYITLATGFYSGDIWYIINSFIPTLVTLPDPVPTPDFSVDPATFDIYEGYYNTEPHRTRCINITKSGTDLLISIAGLDELGVSYSQTLVPEAPHNFFITIDGERRRLTFLFDGQGDLEYLRERYFVGEKVGSCQ